jgi:hypothetical protein
MKSVSSTLSKDRMMNDYVRAQRIKERISKYANDNNKIALKYSFCHIGLKNISITIKASFLVGPAKMEVQKD